MVNNSAEAELFAGAEADAAISTSTEVALCVVTADCAPSAVVCGDVGAVVHAGWQGLMHGVIEATIDAVRSLVGSTAPMTAALGPCIQPSAYAFGADDLALVAARYGDGVRSRTADGQAALDLRAAVSAAFGARGVTVEVTCAADTSSPNWYSHRTRADRERQALFLWRTS